MEIGMSTMACSDVGLEMSLVSIDQAISLYVRNMNHGGKRMCAVGSAYQSKKERE